MIIDVKKGIANDALHDSGSSARGAQSAFTNSGTAVNRSATRP
jgi:hypothetical protein